MPTVSRQAGRLTEEIRRRQEGKEKFEAELEALQVGCPRMSQVSIYRHGHGCTFWDCWDRWDLWDPWDPT